MGGDEFLLLLPECPVDQVPALVARLRGLEVNFRGHRIPVEFSAGCVGYQRAETAEQFLERVDQGEDADKRASKAAWRPSPHCPEVGRIADGEGQIVSARVRR